MTEVEKVNAILVEEFEVDPGLLAPSARLREDLELDSLDAVDLIVAIEKAFSLRIEEAASRKMQTLDDIYEYLGRVRGS